MIIAIDGPAGVGKSTIARMLADTLNLYYVNSGSFYRAITWKHFELGRNPEDVESVIDTAKNLDITVEQGKLVVDGNPVEDKLHSDRIDMWASKHSSIVEIRHIVNDWVRTLAKGMDVIAEGRDITTVVFPNADWKFYFDATPEVRAQRRFEQHPDGPSYEEVLASIIARDENDRNKPFGSLVIAPDAVYIDTSYLTIKAVCEKVLTVVCAQN